MNRLSRCGVLLLTLLLSACSSHKEPSPTLLDLTLGGSENLNPDLNGRPSPLVVRLIELKNPVAFENADFFTLYANARQSLAPDWVAEEELELRPGETQNLKLRVRPDSRYVGLYGAYRDLGASQWRQVIELKPQALTTLRLQLNADGIRAERADQE